MMIQFMKRVIKNIEQLIVALVEFDYEEALKKMEEK